jgi:predicted GNAT family N-acyltransferase
MCHEYLSIEQLSDDQVETLQQLYAREWWSKGRSVEDIRRMLRQTDVMVGFMEPETGELVAFARILTDYVYKALILDVIVAPLYRSNGLGRELMEAIFRHPMLQNVEHFELYCRPEMVPFYAEWGFADVLDQDLRLLRRAA